MQITGLINGEEIRHSSSKILRSFSSPEESLEVFFSELGDLVAAVQATHKAKRSWSAQSFEKRKQKILAFQTALYESFESVKRAELAQSGQGEPFIDSHLVGAKREFEHFFKEIEGLEDYRGTPTGILGVISDYENCGFWAVHKVLMGLLAGNGVFVLGDGDQNLTLSILLQGLFKFDESFKGLVHLLISESRELRDFVVRHPAVTSLVVKTPLAEVKHFKSILSDSFKKVSFESDGRGVALVLDDITEGHCDLLAEGILNFEFYSRTRPSRIFVVEKIIDQFEDWLKTSLLKKSQQMSMSDRGREELFLGAWQKSLKEEGRELLAPEKYSDQKGLSFGPAIIHELPNCAEIQQESVVGPYVSLSRVKYPAEAIKFANTTGLGSFGSIWTQSEDRFRKLSNGLQVPFVQHNNWRALRLRQELFSFKTSFWSNGSSVLDLCSYASYGGEDNVHSSH